MSRNDSVFALNPTNIGISRSRFDRDSQHKTSMNAGELVPIYVDEVLPGDTHLIDTAAVIRSATPIAPVMDNAYMDTYFFFVPSRLCWIHWRQFMGEADTMAWTQTGTYVVPSVTLSMSASGNASNLIGTIGDHMGLPLVSQQVNATKYNRSISASYNELPLRAYALIWNEWFRDQTTQIPNLVNLGDNANSASVLAYTMAPFKVNKFKDRFTACLPAPQKGADVKIPLGTQAKLTTGPLYTATNSNYGYIQVGRSGPTAGLGGNYLIGATSGNGYLVNNNSTGTLGSTAVESINLYADLSNATAATINALRLAFSIQKLFERDARGGTRYREMLKAHFNVNSPDSRFQIPEYLGGKRTPLSMDQVAQTALDSNDEGLGNTGAYSWTSDRGHSCSFSATEHGYIIGVCCIRTDNTYSQGIDPMWTRKERLEFYWPALANIGEQAVYKREIYLDGSNDAAVFGYQEAWSEYRYKKNIVSGILNPCAPNALSYWTYATDLSASPTLNSSFKEETTANIARTLATGTTTQQFVADFYFKNVSVRPMPMYSIPGLLDHN